MCILHHIPHLPETPAPHDSQTITLSRPGVENTRFMFRYVRYALPLPSRHLTMQRDSLDRLAPDAAIDLADE